MSKTAFCGIDSAKATYVNRNTHEEQEASVTQRRHWNADTYAQLVKVGLTSPAIVRNGQDPADFLMIHRAAHAGLKVFVARFSPGKIGPATFSPADKDACAAQGYETRGYADLDSALRWIESNPELSAFHTDCKRVREEQDAEAIRREEERKKAIRSGLRNRVDREAQPLIKVGLPIDVDKVTDALLAAHPSEKFGEKAADFPQGLITLAIVESTRPKTEDKPAKK